MHVDMLVNLLLGSLRAYSEIEMISEVGEFSRVRNCTLFDVSETLVESMGEMWNVKALDSPFGV